MTIFCLKWNRKIETLIVDLEINLEMITKWLRGSGLVVNESKTEICLFHRNDQPLITKDSGIVRLNNLSLYA